MQAGTLVCKLLKNLRGKCADFSSVFVALSRSVGVPAREIFGTRISKDGDITGFYHCHAEFYLQEYGWVPVDPSDVAKLMLKENLDLDDEKIFHYESNFSKALAEVDAGNYQMVFLLNPTKMEHVKEVAGNNLIMPRKSTYFYPKVLTGLVFNKINPHEIIEAP